MTASDTVSFWAGAEYLTCGKLKEFANERQDFTDVCSIVQNYARTYCGCKDSRGNEAPPAPYSDSTVSCNICGSDLQTIDPALAEKLVYTGVSGFQGQCEFLYNLGLSNNGYFSAGECAVIQSNCKTACGCALRRRLRGRAEQPEATEIEMEAEIEAEVMDTEAKVDE